MSETVLRDRRTMRPPAGGGRVDGAAVTALVMMAAIAVVSVYDVAALWVWGTEATVSAVIGRWSTSYPAIPFAAGFICGHLFWRR